MQERAGDLCGHDVAGHYRPLDQLAVFGARPRSLSPQEFSCRTKLGNVIKNQIVNLQLKRIIAGQEKRGDSLASISSVEESCFMFMLRKLVNLQEATIESKDGASLCLNLKYPCTSLVRGNSQNIFGKWMLQSACAYFDVDNLYHATQLCTSDLEIGSEEFPSHDPGRSGYVL